MAQWLELRQEDLVIIASSVQILLWGVGAGPSDETVKPRSYVAVEGPSHFCDYLPFESIWPFIWTI